MMAKNKHRKERHLDELPVSVPTKNKKIVFSFENLDQEKQIPPGYTCEDLQKKGILIYILENFENISRRTEQEAETEEFIHLSKGFPANSEFKCPREYIGDKTVRWAHTRRIKNQKWRVAGYFKDNVFHVVWLDLDHKFWPKQK